MTKDSPKNDILKSAVKKIPKNIALAFLKYLLPIIGSATVASFIEAHDEKKINKLLSIINEKLHKDRKSVV